MFTLTSTNDFSLEIDPKAGTATLSVRSTDADIVLAVQIESANDPELQDAIAKLHTAAKGYDDATPAQQMWMRLIPTRSSLALSYHDETLRAMARWALVSRETTNITYDLTPLATTTLAHTVAAAVGAPVAQIRDHLAEPGADDTFIGRMRAVGETYANTHPIDPEPRFGRRLGWYAAVRALKPRVVLESGVEKGLGAMLLCYALERNAAEGAPGRYIGLDNDPCAGALIAPPYARHAQILTADALDSIAGLTEPVDLYINDGDHRLDYEYREYEAMAPHLSPNALILGDNCHVSDALPRFAEATGQQFLFWHEVPERHWYPGGGIGFAFSPGSGGVSARP